MVDAAARRLSAPKPLGVPHQLFVHHVLEFSFRNEPSRVHDIWALKQDCRSERRKRRSI